MELVFAAGIVVLVAAAALAVYLWRYRVPRLVHTLLPPYEVPDVILVGGVIVENRGRAAAPNVRVNIQFEGMLPSKIHHLDVQSAQPYVLRAGGEQFDFATIRFRELSPYSKVFIYWAASDRVQPRITVTSFNPAGAPLPERVYAKLKDLVRSVVDRKSAPRY